MATVVSPATGEVLMENCVLRLPSGTVTVGGTDATAESELARLTVVPPVRAGSFSVTVPVEGCPPTGLSGLKVSEVTRRDDKTVSVAG